MTDERLEKMLNGALTPDIEDDEIIVNFEERKEPKVYMMKGKIKKVVILAACMCLVVGTTVFAGSKVKYFQSHSNHISDFKSYTDLDNAEKEAGYSADFVEKFSNGYVFDNGNVTDTEGVDDNGNTVVTFKEIFASYKNSDGNTLFVNTENTADYNDTEEERPEPNEVRNISGIDVEYTVYRQLLNVPEDAELTEEEKALKEAGKLWMSYDGGTEIEKYDIGIATWVKDGIKYGIYDHHAVETADSLFGMAEELINK